MQILLMCGSLFLEGLLSFFSPCVLPLIPLYMGYLTKDVKEIVDGEVKYNRIKTFVLTFFFVLGVLFVYVVAACSSQILQEIFVKHALVFEVIGGVILIVLGLMSLQVIRIPAFETTHQKQITLRGKMTWLKAWLLGFFFSFAWTPCTGPLLAQAIVLATQATSKVLGWLYIGCFAFGFIVVFLLLGLFTEEVLYLLKKYKKVVRYTHMIAGICVIFGGCYMLFQAYSTYQVSTNTQTQNTEKQTAVTTIEDLDFTLLDGNEKQHTLSQYKGKTIIVNFFGTWCHYCNQELPVFEKIQQENSDIQILLIALPNMNGEGDITYIENYMQEYDLQILYDRDASITQKFGVSGYPCSFIIQPDGTYMGYIPGYIGYEDLVEILSQVN